MDLDSKSNTGEGRSAGQTGSYKCMVGLALKGPGSPTAWPLCARFDAEVQNSIYYNAIFNTIGQLIVYMVWP